MEIIQINIGKTDDIRLEQLIGDYQKRINRFNSFRIENIQTPKKTGKAEPEIQKKIEGELIIKKIDTPAYVILLDERGKSFSSTKFANYIEGMFMKGLKRIYFITGGAYGFSQEVYNYSNEIISLSPMTTTHQLVRLLFAEQLYRAFTIINNHPYHND